MEDDVLAPFADLLLDDTGAVQEPGRLQELHDNGQLHDYSNGLLADFSIWDDGFESKPKVPIVQPPAKDRLGVTSDSPAELLTASSAEVSAPFVGEICAFCLGFRALVRCPNCISAYCCSKEHLAAHSRIHETSCGSDATTSNFPKFSESVATQGIQGDLAPADSELRSEILELLSMFQVVYEKKSSPGHTCNLLQKCIAMCERIMDRHYRIPQVVAMREQAKSLLQLFQNEGYTECPFSTTPNENRACFDSGMSVRDHLKADVKGALDKVDAEEEARNLLKKDSDGGEEVNGVYCRKGIRYCKVHIDRQQCDSCGVDYRLFNELHRENASEDVDATVRKEQERLEDLELERHVATGDTTIEEDSARSPSHIHRRDSSDTEDFQSVAKDLKEELDRARERETADFLEVFSSFQIS